MTRNSDNQNSMTRSTKTNLFLNICVAFIFVSTITTCGVEANKASAEEDNLELSENALNTLEHLLQEIPDEEEDSIEEHIPSFDGDTFLTKKNRIPRLYKRNGREEMPRLYKKRGQGEIPRLYKKASRQGVPRMYKRGDEDENLVSYAIYRRDQMPRLYKKSGDESESFGDDFLQWQRQSRSSGIPRLYRKRSSGAIPRLYKKADQLHASRSGRAMTPRLYKKSSFMKKMLPRLYKRANAVEMMPRLY